MDPSLNPGGKGLKSPDLTLLLKTQFPNLPVTLHREEPGTGSDQIAKPNPCDVPNLHEISIHSGFQEHIAMFDINKLSDPTSVFDADLYVDNYPPSA